MKLLAITKTEKLEFFCEFLRRMGVVERVPRYVHRCQFFYRQPVCQKLYSCNKIIGDLKNGKIRIFFVFLEQIRAVLVVFRGTCIVANFFYSQSVCQKLYSCNKIIGDLKNGKIRFFFVFLEQIRAVLGVFRGALSVPNFWCQSACQKLYSGNKIIVDLKNGVIRIFFVFLG